MIFDINTKSDFPKFLYVISRAVRRMKFETILKKKTSVIYAKDHVQIMLLFVYTTTRKSFVIFTCRYFKLSWNITSLSQSNCGNFSRSIKNGDLDACSVANIPRGVLGTRVNPDTGRIRVDGQIGHFRVPLGLNSTKTRLNAQPLIWKWFFILMQIKPFSQERLCAFESQ